MAIELFGKDRDKAEKICKAAQQLKALAGELCTKRFRVRVERAIDHLFDTCIRPDSKFSVYQPTFDELVGFVRYKSDSVRHRMHNFVHRSGDNALHYYPQLYPFFAHGGEVVHNSAYDFLEFKCGEWEPDEPMNVWLFGIFHDNPNIAVSNNRIYGAPVAIDETFEESRLRGGWEALDAMGKHSHMGWGYFYYQPNRKLKYYRPKRVKSDDDNLTLDLD